MSFSLPGVVVDKDGKEITLHGNTAFPLAAYDDDLSDVPWHWHDEFEVGIITEGAVRISTPACQVVLYPGEGFFINSQVPHQMVPESEPARLHSLVFHENLISGSADSILHIRYMEPLMRDQGKYFVKFSPSAGSTQLLCNTDSVHPSEITKAWDACIRKAPGYEFTVRALLSGLLYAICSMPSASVSKMMGKEIYRIKDMLLFIEMHYQEPLSLHQIASSAHISDSEANRVFRRVVGITPVKYLIRYRMEIAASLLKKTDMKIAEVCTACGYTDLSYFVKTFREYYEVSPGRYRGTNPIPS